MNKINTNKYFYAIFIVPVISLILGIGLGELVESKIVESKINSSNIEYDSIIENFEKEKKNLTNKIIILESQNEALNNIIAEYITEETPKENDNGQTEYNNITTSKNVWTVGEKVPLPILPTNIKSYTDYRVYNVEGTPHKRLQQVAWTDEHGCRRYNDDYIVALGSFYSTDIGDRFEVTLDTGRVFTIILGDGKADCDTDVNNMYAPCINYDGEMCANVIEFIIDKYVVDSEMYSYGSLDYHSEFKGNIVEMIYLGRDSSGDWSSYM